MDTLISFVVALVVFGILAGIIAIAAVGVMKVHAEKRRFRESLSRRLKGGYLPGNFMVNARIELEIGGRKAAVEFIPSGGKNDPGRTLVIVPLQGASPGTLHILREGFSDFFLKLFGAQDISIGDRAFDAAYVVKATPESLAAKVFAPHRRSQVIAAVRRLEFLRNATIELTRDQLRLQVREELKVESGVLALVQTAEDFLEFLRLEMPGTGVELGEVKIAVDSACPVCGTPLGGAAVRCEACKTPHHAECWKYVGQCSTYACNGKRYAA